MRLFDADNGGGVSIDRATAVSVARAAHSEGTSPTQVSPLGELTLAKHSSYYMSGTTGDLLERRNDNWRWWDFFWILHNMDYELQSANGSPLSI